MTLPYRFRINRGFAMVAALDTKEPALLGDSSGLDPQRSGILLHIPCTQSPISRTLKTQHLPSLFYLILSPSFCQRRYISTSHAICSCCRENCMTIRTRRNQSYRCGLNSWRGHLFPIWRGLILSQSAGWSGVRRLRRSSRRRFPGLTSNHGETQDSLRILYAWAAGEEHKRLNHLLGKANGIQIAL